MVSVVGAWLGLGEAEASVTFPGKRGACEGASLLFMEEKEQV